MKTSELITRLTDLVDKHGDKDVAIDDGIGLAPISEVDASIEEDDAIVIWFEL